MHPSVSGPASIYLAQVYWSHPGSLQYLSSSLTGQQSDRARFFLCICDDRSSLSSTCSSKGSSFSLYFFYFRLVVSLQLRLRYVYTRLLYRHLIFCKVKSKGLKRERLIGLNLSLKLVISGCYGDISDTVCVIRAIFCLSLHLHMS